MDCLTAFEKIPDIREQLTNLVKKVAVRSLDYLLTSHVGKVSTLHDRLMIFSTSDSVSRTNVYIQQLLTVSEQKPVDREWAYEDFG